MDTVGDILAGCDYMQCFLALVLQKIQDHTDLILRIHDAYCLRCDNDCSNCAIDEEVASNLGVASIQSLAAID